MCFSATVSFISSAALVIGGIFCVQKSLRVKNHFLMSITPFLFAIQQLIEGFVWIGINHSDKYIIDLFSTFYLFFAFCFWLVWFPLVAYSTESVKWKQILFIILIVIGLTFGLYLWLPVLLGYGPRTLIETVACGKSLCYNLAGGGYMPGLLREYIYALLCLLYLSCTDVLFKKFWTIVMFSALITFIIHTYAQASVWCFFSAMASFYIYFLIKPLSTKQRIANMMGFNILF